MSSDVSRKKTNNLAIFLTIGFLFVCMAVCFLFVDEPVFAWLKHNSLESNSSLEDAFELLGKVYEVIWLLLFWVWITGKHKTVLISLLAMLITVPAVWSIKAAVKRPRPSFVIKTETKIENKEMKPQDRSFPSGDTATVFAIGTVLAFSVPWPWVIAIALCCSGIGVLRVTGLAHYPSDVCAGAAIGIFCGWAAIRIRNKESKIENILAGKEQMLSFLGIFLIPLLIWFFQGHEKLDVLLTFYVPAATVIFFLVRWKLHDKTEQADGTHISRWAIQNNWFFRWSGFLPLVIVPLFVICLLHFSYPQSSHPLDRVWELFCFAISLSGLGLRIYTTGQVSAAENDESQSNTQELETTGMYSIVRHPLYIGTFIIWTGIILLSRSISLAAFCFLAFLIYYERIIITKEDFLSRKFGDAFSQWAQKTPMFIPKFKLWRKPIHPFSWKFAVIREYPVFLAIIASFTAIEILGDRFYIGKWEFDGLWTAIFCASLLVFVTLRILKKLRCD
jgi:protein-S-isoprenylcysteine O-methyltransferase Ste14